MNTHPISISSGGGGWSCGCWGWVGITWSGFSLWAHPISAQLSKIAQVRLAFIVGVPLILLFDFPDLRLVVGFRLFLRLDQSEDGRVFVVVKSLVLVGLLLPVARFHLLDAEQDAEDQ
jgi:hypothetical protein